MKDKVVALSGQAEEKSAPTGQSGSSSSAADAETAAEISKRNMNMQQLPLYPKLVEKILFMYETLFGEKFQTDSSSKGGFDFAS